MVDTGEIWRKVGWDKRQPEIDALTAERDTLRVELADANETIAQCREIVNATSEDMAVDLRRLTAELIEWKVNCAAAVGALLNLSECAADTGVCPRCRLAMQFLAAPSSAAIVRRVENLEKFHATWVEEMAFFEVACPDAPEGSPEMMAWREKANGFEPRLRELSAAVAAVEKEGK